MTAIETAIREAVEKGGWMRQYNARVTGFDGLKVYFSLNENALEMSQTYRIQIFQVFLDPTFWQALGKARGWDERRNPEDGSYYSKPEWLEHWHLFVDWLAADKDAESFFASLTNK